MKQINTFIDNLKKIFCNEKQARHNTLFASFFYEKSLLLFLKAGLCHSPP